jgi:uncharacterized phage-associated protein
MAVYSQVWRATGKNFPMLQLTVMTYTAQARPEDSLRGRVWRSKREVDMSALAPEITAQEVANYFIASVDRESGDNITNLKLQKLLYYAQGFHVAMHDGEPLFSESVLAWKHGPVVKQVYQAYHSYEWRPIDPPAKFQAERYLPEVREILDAVNSTYGQFTATRLESMTHGELPWRKTESSRVISLDLLKKYFSTLVEAGRLGQAVEGRPVWPIKSFHFQRRNEIASGLARHRQMLKAHARPALIDVD